MADDSGSDISLPKATITKLVKEYMPPDLRTSAETTEKLLECCTEFVNVVSAQANELATSDKKLTIAPEHVLRALEALGFGDYVEDVRAAWDLLKEESKNAPKLAGRRTKAEEAGLSEQEQIRMQQELFAQARARSLSLQEAQEASVRAQFLQQQQSGAMPPPPPHHPHAQQQPGPTPGTP
ncbi:hypothetical protein Rsub_02720 [Raphidocelis subcapitata]|uniref:Transcription factor CBF/NF-Y/archaeal histone domain-containing protein n=1 Tax=Raphidocelis subcapitata TaxID=307507 RepID=A0A2V0NQU9_9CHLO|nr:hypothetical protein Rsub_02720 [Raphidocelis subcapitata]|eukprot:GBF90014.1 hypothetical protein Rsub_02720 [Raphidocelis subcapitata]